MSSTIKLLTWPDDLSAPAESCPANTEGYMAMPGDEMPSYIGKNLMDAMDHMVPIASVTATDATAAGRSVDNENDWKVCGSVPVGETIEDSVEFEAVLNDESCPG